MKTGGPAGTRPGRGAPWVLLAALVLALSGCPKSRDAVAPIPSRYFVGPDRAHSTLIIFLPGNGDPVDRYGKPELLDIISNAGIAADVMAVDAHAGYYRTQTLVNRLRTDIIEPAQSFGYRDIWLIGNSLGGLGALYYMKFHPGDIRGAILLGPFLGFESIIQEVDHAGGAARWAPGRIAPEDWERAFWVWIKETVSGDFALRRIFLGYGNRDRLLQGQKLLADVLPPDQVLEIPGGHDWRTWRRLLEHFLVRQQRIRTSGPDRPAD